LSRFAGSSEHSLDDKGRFVVPARYRERLGAGFVLTIAAPDPCLALYPLNAWDAFCERLEAAEVKDRTFRRVVRRIFSMSEEVTCDGQGRLLIPAGHRAYAGIERQALAVGTLRRIEIWAPAHYDDNVSDDDEAAALASGLGLF
jgi:MraZ protein